LRDAGSVWERIPVWLVSIPFSMLKICWTIHNFWIITLKLCKFKQEYVKIKDHNPLKMDYAKKNRQF